MFYRPHDRVTKTFKDPSRTKQSFAEESDINRIIAKYRKTGTITWLNRHEAMSGDFSNVPDFMQAQNVVAHAQRMFDDLPANLRRRFNNDPAEFLGFIGNAENKDEMVRLGLARKPPPAVTEPASPPGANPVPPAPEPPAGQN